MENQEKECKTQEEYVKKGMTKQAGQLILQTAGELTEFPP